MKPDKKILSLRPELPLTELLAAADRCCDGLDAYIEKYRGGECTVYSPRGGAIAKVVGEVMKGITAAVPTGSTF